MNKGTGRHCPLKHGGVSWSHSAASEAEVGNASGTQRTCVMLSSARGGSRDAATAVGS